MNCQSEQHPIAWRATEKIESGGGGIAF